MKKSLAFLLLCIHLGGNTEAGQLFRLPILVEHYKFHHSADPSIDFIGFVIMHYAGDDGIRTDDQEDNRLPCHDWSHSSVSAVFLPMVKALPSVMPLPVLNNSSPVEITGDIPSKHVRILLQPPR